MTETYIKFRDLILKAEGRTIEEELGFGCRLMFNGEVFFGIPITLERVLKAFGSDYFIDGNGTIGFCPDVTRARIVTKWELGKPAHEQSEETLNSLIEILK